MNTQRQEASVLMQISLFKFQYDTMLKVDIAKEWDVVYASPSSSLHEVYWDTSYLKRLR